MTKTAVILANLGSPTTLSTRDIRLFLRDFLSDRFVVDLPRVLWLPILYFAILPFRPKGLIKQYEAIWTENGSPLLAYTESLANKIKHPDYTVFSAMRYRTPSLKKVLAKIKNDNFEEIIILPLYPQYNASTTGSLIDETKRIVKKWQSPPAVELITHYHNETAHIDAICKSITNHWGTQGKSELLLFSFHGVPVKMIEAGDPYLDHCQKTVAAIVKKLKLSENEYRLVFQSRFGKAKWLEPYCSQTLENLPKEGVSSVDVVCPGFAVDCLETLYEISKENEEIFQSAGGKTLTYIPALNDSELHVDSLCQILQDRPTSITLNIDT